MLGPEAAATFRLVRDRIDAGDDVTVVSPAPSAAHHHADPGGPRGAMRLARLVAGADELQLRLDASSLGASDDVRLLPGRLALSRACKRPRVTEIRLDRVPPRVSARWAALILRDAARVRVDTDAEREALVRAGVAPDKVVVEPEHHDQRRPRRPPPEASGEAGQRPTTAAELQAVVARRAVEERARSRRSASSAGTASQPLRHLARMERAPVRSNKVGGSFVKRAINKAMAWQFDNVIASVNRLHQATIDAIDALEAGQASDDTKR
jgi:hypothetical protein